MHDVLVTDIARLLLNVFKSAEIGGLSKLPLVLKQAYAEDVFVVYETMHAILSDLNKLDSDETRLALQDSNLIQDALIEATDDKGDAALRLKCTNLLIEIWLEHPAIVNEPSMQSRGIGSLPLRDSFHFVLEQGTLAKDMIFRVNIFANSFSLLDQLVAIGDKETKPVFKTLANGLLALYAGKTSDLEIDQVSTEMILKGFKTVFELSDNELVRKSDLLDPFVDQLIKNLH